jgi:hypothetical protein
VTSAPTPSHHTHLVATDRPKARRTRCPAINCAAKWRQAFCTVVRGGCPVLSCYQSSHSNWQCQKNARFKNAISGSIMEQVARTFQVKICSALLWDGCPVRYFLRSILKYKSATTLYCRVASRPFPKYYTNSLYADFLPRHMMVINSVLDSDSLIPDPDPAF